MLKGKVTVVLLLLVGMGLIIALGGNQYSTVADGIETKTPDALLPLSPNLLVSISDTATSSKDITTDSEILENFQLYENMTGGFKIQYPKDWNFTEHTSPFSKKFVIDFSPIQYISELYNPYLVQVFSVSPFHSSNDTRMSLYEIGDELLYDVKLSNPPVPYTLSPLTIAEYSGLKIDIGSYGRNVTHVVLMEGDKAFDILYGIPVEDPTNFLDTVNKMIGSFRII